ncbi:MAG: WD40 repeat domain-containing serine/threonine protein kinase [Polyangiaceae bacterium]
MTKYHSGDIIDDKFRVVRLIGRGGMGEVHEIVHLGLEKTYALKTLLADAAANTTVAERFLQEGRAAARLHSPHVCIVVDAGSFSDGSKYLLMELLQGRSLGQVLRHDGALTLERAADVLIEACDALSEAHNVGIVHRDLKPDNLFLARQPGGAEVVKVLDFGISKMPRGALLTTGSDVFGTPYYMSPEQLVASRDVDARSDVWSLGVCLFELLTNQRPWDADEPISLATKIMTEPPRPIESLLADAPAQLVSLLQRCLERDVSKRCPTAQAFAEGLTPFASERGRDAFKRLRAQTDALGATAASTSQPPLQPLPPNAGSLSGMSPSTQSGRESKTAQRGIRPRTLTVAAIIAVIAGGSASLAIALRKESAPSAGSRPEATTDSSTGANKAPSSSNPREVLRTTTLRDSQIQTLAFSPGGNMLMIVGAEHGSHVLRRWDVRDSALFLRETALAQEARGFFASSGEWYSTVTTEGDVKLYSTLAGGLAHSYVTKGALASVPLPDGTGIVVAHSDKSIRLWESAGRSPSVLANLPGTPLGQVPCCV